MDRPSAMASRTRFSADGDEDLLAYMAVKDDPSCREAGSEFYVRHRGFLFAVLKMRRFGQLVGGEEGLVDVVQMTFHQAYESAHTYRPSGTDDPEHQRRACRKWLVGIARNLILDSLRRPVSVVADLPLDDSLELIADVELQGGQESEAAREMGRALADLSEKEQEVLRTTMEFYKPGERNQRLPNNVAANLARQLSTTPENVRAIRMRAMNKLRARMEAWFAIKRGAKK